MGENHNDTISCSIAIKQIKKSAGYFFNKSIEEVLEETKNDIPKDRSLFYNEGDFSVFSIFSLLNWDEEVFEKILVSADQADLTGNKHIALALWEDAVTLCEERCMEDDDNWGKKTKSYFYIGLVYFNKAYLSRAIEFCKKALSIITSENKYDTVLNFRTYDLLGSIYQEQGNFDLSIDSFLKALSIKETISNINIEDFKYQKAKSFDLLGTAYYKKGDLNNSLIFYNEAIKIIDNEKIGYYLKAKCYNNFARSCYVLKDYNKTIELCSKAIAIIDQAYHPETAISFLYLGNTYYNLKDYEQAEVYYQKSLEKLKKIYRYKHPETAKVIIQLGLLSISKGDKINGLDYLEKAFNIIKETSAFQDIINASTIICTNLFDMKYYSNAVPILFTTIELIEKVRKVNLSGGIDFIHRNINSYYYAILLYHKLVEPEELFNKSERMRAMSYNERISIKTATNAIAIGTDISAKLLNLKDVIERLTINLQRLVSLSIFEMNDKQKKSHYRQFSEISTQLEKAESDFTALDESLMSNDKYKSLRKPDIATLEDAKKLCADDGIIFEYIIPQNIGPHLNPYLLVITSANSEIIELEKDYKYADKIQEFRNAVIKHKENLLTPQKNKENESILSVELYSKLIEPALKSIDNTKYKRIIIVPDSTLAFLPFDSLKNSKGIYLSQQYDLSLTPSISVSVMIQERNYKCDKNFLGFGGGIYSDEDDSNNKGERTFRNTIIDPAEKERIASNAFNNPAEYFSELAFTWDNLPHAELEVKTISSDIFNSEDSDIITGTGVTEKNLKELSAQGKLIGYSALHFACHGYYDTEYPLYSALVFSEVSGKITDSDEDGYLTVEDTSLLNLQSEIVVLSACETGMGKFVSGDGVTGLTRAFQVAGAKRVLVTLWKVDDEATKDLMTGMYRKVKDGASYREAIVKTKEEFRKSGKYEKPYYWAGFVLYE